LPRYSLQECHHARKLVKTSGQEVTVTPPSVKQSGLSPKNILGPLILGVVASFFLAMTTYSSWGSYHTAVGYYYLISFLSVTCASMALVQYRQRLDHQTLLHSPLVFFAVANLLTTLRFVLDQLPYGSDPIQAVVGDLSSLALFGVLLLFAAVSQHRGIEFRHEQSVSFLLIASGTATLLLLNTLTPLLDHGSIVYVAITLSVLVSASITLAGLLWYRTKAFPPALEPRLAIAGFGVLGLSWVPSVLAILLTDETWRFIAPMKVAGLVVVCLAVAVPHLGGFEWRASNAVLYSLSFSLLGLSPTYFALLGEAVFPGYYPSVDGYRFVHAGAAVLSCGMALLVLSYDRDRMSSNRYPLAFLFIAWSSIEALLLFRSLLYPPDPPGGMLLIPYIVGSALTLVLLVFAARWTRAPLPREYLPRLRVIAYAGAPVAVGLVLFGFGVEGVLEGSVVGLKDSPVGSIVSLIVGLFVAFSYVYLGSLMASQTRGRFTVDLLAIGFLGLWIIPQLIKSNYGSWSYGWWISELMVVAGLLLGPAVLGHFYIREISRAEASQKQATLYADLLIHDVSNYHQTLTICLGLLAMDDLPKEQRLMALRDASTDLMRADQLVKNVRRMSVIDKLERKPLGPIDLVQTAEEAFGVVSRNAAAEGFVLRVNRKRGECFALANELLLDVFLNLFTNSIQHSGDDRTLSVDVRSSSQRGRSFWVTTITDFGKGISPSVKSKLFTRFMDGSDHMGLGLSVVRALVDIFDGQITVRDRVEDDYTKGTIFEITLPAAKIPVPPAADA